MTKMLQRHRHVGKLRDPEELVVRCQLRYLADVLTELRRQPGRGFVATGLPEHVAKNNTRFSAHVLLDFGGPVSAGGPAGGPGLVLHQRVVRPKDLGICSEARHRHHLLSPREVTGTAGLQPAPAAMSSLSRTWRTSRQCSPALLGGLASNAEPGISLNGRSARRQPAAPAAQPAGPAPAASPAADYRLPRHPRQRRPQPPRPGSSRSAATSGSPSAPRSRPAWSRPG